MSVTGAMPVVRDRTLRDVSFTFLGDNDERVLIEGACLAEDQGWVLPVTRTSSGKRFVELRTCSRMFPKFCGARGQPLKYNKFLEDMVGLRNHVCDEALGRLAQERGEQLTKDSKLNKFGRVRGGKAALAALPDCPEDVQVTMETLDPDKEVELTTLTMLFAASYNAAAVVLLDEDKFARIARTIQFTGSAGVAAVARGRKRSRADKTTFKYPEIIHRASQNAAMVKCRKVNGKFKYHQLPLESTGDDAADDAHNEQVAETLHKFYLENHVGGPIHADDAGEDADETAEGE